MAEIMIGSMSSPTNFFLLVRLFCIFLMKMAYACLAATAQVTSISPLCMIIIDRLLKRHICRLRWKDLLMKDHLQKGAFKYQCMLYQINNYFSAMNHLPPQHDDHFYNFIERIKEGEIPQVEQILQEKSEFVNTIHPLSKQPPLYYAAVHNNDDQSAQMIKLLLRYGANVKFKDRAEQTIIFYICRQGKQKCAELLLTHGLSLDEVDFYDQTPIFYAISENKLEIVRKYATKERINHVDKLAGQTPIYYAARRGHLQMCRLLVEKGANITHLDQQNKLAAQYAKRAKFLQTAQYLNEEFKKVKGLEKSGENISPEQSKKLLSLIKAPKQTFKIVLYNKKGQSYDLTETQATALLKQNPKLKEFLDNPESITEEELTNASQTWQKIALKMVGNCCKVKGSYYFTQAVDPVKLGVLDYFDKIAHPMDLGTIKQRLLHNYYLSPADFVEDMKLIWQNSYLYNGKQHFVSKCANQLEHTFNNLVQTTGLNKYLNAQ